MPQVRDDFLSFEECNFLKEQAANRFCPQCEQDWIIPVVSHVVGPWLISLRVVSILISTNPLRDGWGNNNVCFRSVFDIGPSFTLNHRLRS